MKHQIVRQLVCHQGKGVASRASIDPADQEEGQRAPGRLNGGKVKLTGDDEQYHWQGPDIRAEQLLDLRILLQNLSSARRMRLLPGIAVR